MEQAIPTLRELRREVEAYFGGRARYVSTRRDSVESTSGLVRFTLYDSFVFSFVVADQPYTSLAVVHHLPDDTITSTLLGEELTFLETIEALATAFEVVDRYCRLRLPDKFLDAFDTR